MEALYLAVPALAILCWIYLSLARKPLPFHFAWVGAAALAWTCAVLTIPGHWAHGHAAGVAGLFFLLWLPRHDHVTAPRGKRIARAAIGVAGLLALAVAGLLIYALPIPVLPKPAGPFQIGTMTWQFDDATRKDPYAPAPDQPRKIMLQVWYPAAAKDDAPPAAWSNDIGVFGPAIARKFGLPAFSLDHLSHVRSNSHEQAPLKTETAPWPVIVYSHGWTGFRTIALDEVEALASQGFVVFAPDHIYGALATVLKDGTPVLNNPKAMPPDEPKDARQKGIELLVDTYAGDLRFVIDTIEKMNAGAIASPFAGHLNMAKLGLFGHSTGGGAVYEVAATDPRVKCVFGLDTWTEPISQDVRDRPLTVPFYSLRSAQWAQRDDAKSKILAELLAKAQGPKYDYYVEGSKHADFTLMPILSPFAGTLGMTGPIDGRRVLELGNAYLVAFFNQYLKGTESPLLAGVSKDYPEVKPADAAAAKQAARPGPNDTNERR